MAIRVAKDVMRQRKLLRSDALTCGPPKLDDAVLDPKPWSDQLVFLSRAQASMHAGPRCYMQMGKRICTCSRHINRSSQPGRPSQAGKQESRAGG